MTQTRRRHLLTLAFALGACSARRKGGEPTPPAPAGPNLDRSPSADLAQLEAEVGGRLGVYGFCPSLDFELGHRESERFAMCSTFKWALAALMLAQRDRGELVLREPLTFTRADLLDYAPVARPLLEKSGQDVATFSIEDCMHAVVTLSDNTLANLLLRRAGGPSALNEFLRELGDATTRLDRWEPQLNENAPGDPQDTTSPRAMAQAFARALSGDALSAPSQKHLTQLLVKAPTGARRLRAGFPAHVLAGDKTGTGARGACNDVAMLETRGGPAFLACYLSGSTAPLARLERVHREVGALFYQELKARENSP